MLYLLQNHSKIRVGRFILLTGLLVGTLDILSAFVDYFINTGKNPLAVLTFVASGAFGTSAVGGGAGIMIMGLLFHYFFAFAFTIIFFMLYSRNRNQFSKSRIVTGVLYGVFIWLIMNLVVVQLSNAPHAAIKDMKIGKISKSMLILIFMIGLPLSFINYNYFNHKLEKE